MSIGSSAAPEPSLTQVAATLMTFAAMVIGGAAWLPSPGPDGATAISRVHLAQEEAVSSPGLARLSQDDKALNALLLAQPKQAHLEMMEEPRLADSAPGARPQSQDPLHPKLATDSRPRHSITPGLGARTKAVAVAPRGALREGSKPALSERPGRGLEVERRLLDEARSALGAGERTRALSLLKRHFDMFRRGYLAEERDSLWVRVLADLGEVQQAKRRAERFLGRYPMSVHRKRVERVLEGLGE